MHTSAPGSAGRSICMLACKADQDSSAAHLVFVAALLQVADIPCAGVKTVFIPKQAALQRQALAVACVQLTGVAVNDHNHLSPASACTVFFSVSIINQFKLTPWRQGASF